MQIRCIATKTMRCTPEAAFALMVDTARFPAMFTGYGPIPSIHAVVLEGPLAVGARRRIHNSDGSVLDERVTALEAPRRHGYTLGGFTAPFSWLVSRGESDWTINADTTGTQLRWQYDFSLASAAVYPLAFVLLRFFMARAMQRCLDHMALELEGSREARP